jgi:hypothetical protein
MIVAAWFSVVVGVLMLGQWSFFLLTRQVPELRTRPAEIGLHIAAEFITALLLLVSGLGLLARAAWGAIAYLVATGMLLYTLIVSPGYYVQRRTWPLVVMFAVLFVLALVTLGLALVQMVAG